MKTCITTSHRLFILVVTFLTSLPPIASAMPSQADKFVNDFADVITESVREDIVSKAADIRGRYNGTQIAVVTVNSLDGLTIERYATTLFNSWGLGDRKANNGLLFLIVPNGNLGSRLRIEVGIGLEKVITNKIAGNILDQVLPYYEKGDYSTVAATGFDLIAQRIEEKLKISKRNPQRNNIVADIAISLIAFFVTLGNMLARAFWGAPSLKKVERMGMTDGDYTTEDASIFNKAQKKATILWLSGIPLAVIVQLLLRTYDIGEFQGGYMPLSCLIMALYAVVVSILYNKIKYVCPACSSILEHAGIVEEESTYITKGKMRVYLVCHTCGKKYVGIQFIPKKIKFLSGDMSDSSYIGGSSSGGGGSGGSGGGGGHSGGGGASR
jgi:uncharacterized protein